MLIVLVLVTYYFVTEVEGGRYSDDDRYHVRIWRGPSSKHGYKKHAPFAYYFKHPAPSDNGKKYGKNGYVVKIKRY